MSPLYLNSSVFFELLIFLFFTGFRRNILLTNNSNDPLLLPLVFLKKMLVLSINNFQNLSCAITLTVDWCYIYILFFNFSEQFS